MIKFYYIKSGVRGLLPNGKWMTFSTEEEYIEYIREEDN